MDTAPFRGPGVTIPPPVLFLIGFLTGLALHRLAPGDVVPLSLASPLRVLGLADDRAWPLLFLPLVILVLHGAVIRREETYLSEHFGETYDSYRRRVPRWFGRPDR